MEQHPYIKAAIGSGCEWSEKRIVAPIRLGGVPRVYDRQLLILGDAAGYVDPLTGEGIHTAMISGQIAASTTIEMFSKHNYSMDACRAYSLRCYDAFGYEFVYSYLAAHVIYYIPISLDAIACIGMFEASTSIIHHHFHHLIIVIIILVLLLLIIINILIITTIINIYNY
jgi:flavin-dependent dehydrogenase